LYTLQSPVLHEKCQSWTSTWGAAVSLCAVHTCTALGLPASAVGARGERSQVAAPSARGLGHCFVLCRENGNHSARPWLAWALKTRKNLRSSTT